MRWNPTSFVGRYLLSKVGGIIPGIVVAIVATLVVAALVGGFDVLNSWNQGRKAVNAVGDFFREWENDVNSTDELLTSDGRLTLSRCELQFAKHKHYLGTVRTRLDRWSKSLSVEQSEGIALLLDRHERAAIKIIPEGSCPGQNFYDVFFSNARTIEWLK